MTPHPKLQHFVTNRHARAATITQAMHVAGDNIYCLDAIITTTLQAVEREAQAFRDYVGEPLPAHVRDALERERWSWQYLQESLSLYRDSDPNPRDAVQYLMNVRRFLGYQHDLVCTEAAMLQTCLVEEYREQITRLTARLREVPL